MKLFRSRNKKKSKLTAFKRSKTDKIIGGVMGGAGEYFEVDSTLIRIVWLICLALTGFVPGVVAYVAAVLFVPIAKR